MESTEFSVLQLVLLVGISKHIGIDFWQIELVIPVSESEKMDKQAAGY